MFWSRAVSGCTNTASSRAVFGCTSTASSWRITAWCMSCLGPPLAWWRTWWYCPLTRRGTTSVCQRALCVRGLLLIRGRWSPSLIVGGWTIRGAVRSPAPLWLRLALVSMATPIRSGGATVRLWTTTTTGVGVRQGALRITAGGVSSTCSAAFPWLLSFVFCCCNFLLFQFDIFPGENRNHLYYI